MFYHSSYFFVPEMCPMHELGDTDVANMSGRLSVNAANIMGPSAPFLRHEIPGRNPGIVAKREHHVPADRSPGTSQKAWTELVTLATRHAMTISDDASHVSTNVSRCTFHANEPCVP